MFWCPRPLTRKHPSRTPNTQRTPRPGAALSTPPSIGCSLPNAEIYGLQARRLSFRALDVDVKAPRTTAAGPIPPSTKLGRQASGPRMVCNGAIAPLCAKHDNPPRLPNQIADLKSSFSMRSMYVLTKTRAIAGADRFIGGFYVL